MGRGFESHRGHRKSESYKSNSLSFCRKISHKQARYLNRNSNMNTSVSVVYHTSKTLKNGNHPLMLRVTQNRKSQYVSLGILISPEHWDECYPFNDYKISKFHKQTIKRALKKENVLSIVNTPIELNSRSPYQQLAKKSSLVICSPS